MLRYVAYGIREYQRRPVRPAQRERWEFEGALWGRIAPVIRGWEIPVTERRLWILPPNYGHGWTGDGHEALVAVLSPIAVPVAIELAASHAARAGRLLSWDMSKADVDWLGERMEDVVSKSVQPDGINRLRQEQFVIELCVRILEAISSGFSDRPNGGPSAVVDAAVLWMRLHIASGIKEHDVADAMHVSPPHLRRLFHRVMGRSPRDVLQQTKMQKVDQLLADSDFSLSEIASRCGFSNASGLCRAYRRIRGRSPGIARGSRLDVNIAP